MGVYAHIPREVSASLLALSDGHCEHLYKRNEQQYGSHAFSFQTNR